MQSSLFLNAKFMTFTLTCPAAVRKRRHYPVMINAKFIILNTKPVIFNAKFIILNRIFITYRKRPTATSS